VVSEPAASGPVAQQATPAAPAATAPANASVPTSVSPEWRQALAGWLSRHKAYPEEARRRGIEGVVVVRFSVDRNGHVIDATVLRGSGFPLLDDATVTMLRGATVPAPTGLTGGQTTVSIQVHYALTE